MSRFELVKCRENVLPFVLLKEVRRRVRCAKTRKDGGERDLRNQSPVLQFLLFTHNPIIVLLYTLYIYLSEHIPFDRLGSCFDIPPAIPGCGWKSACRNFISDTVASSEPQYHCRTPFGDTCRPDSADCRAASATARSRIPQETEQFVASCDLTQDRKCFISSTYISLIPQSAGRSYVEWVSSSATYQTTRSFSHDQRMVPFSPII